MVHPLFILIFDSFFDLFFYFDLSGDIFFEDAGVGQGLNCDRSLAKRQADCDVASGLLIAPADQK